jgi:hypothetical protein
VVVVRGVRVVVVVGWVGDGWGGLRIVVLVVLVVLVVVVVGGGTFLCFFLTTFRAGLVAGLVVVVVYGAGFMHTICFV